MTEASLLFLATVSAAADGGRDSFNGAVAHDRPYVIVSRNLHRAAFPSRLGTQTMGMPR
jgi:hypothetical protein